MDPGYQTVMDPTTVVWGALAMVVHLGVMLTQAGLALFLVVSGVRLAVQSEQRGEGTLWVGLGVLVAGPLLAAAPFPVSLLACLGALGILLALDRDVSGGRLARWIRAAAIGCGGVTALFMLWEREDPLALGVELVSTAQQWRTHELDWQLVNDLEAPKIGELAPDFELQDPSGRAAVRLADFRGARAVALVFGSYT
jgi:hypothetical protein